MLIKILLLVVLTMGMASFVGANTSSSADSSTKDPQKQTTSSASPAKDNNSTAGQPANVDEKKPTMADYCRKHTC